ncbi:MAG TPA: NnrS family protein [Myxococcota bacterium]|nr:NnrS family protein [Myxococcota bacterium]
MTLFQRGFRPFFLLAGAQASVSVLAWLGVFAGLFPAPGWLAPSLWHAHEMLFGFVAAAAAGFLLTAAPTWTASAPVSGAPLAALATLWLAGRIAMALAGVLPLPVVAAADLAFLPALAFAVARPILATRQVRNAGFPLVLAALALLDLGAQLDACGLAPGLAPACIHGGVDLALVLIVLVGGRITPSFTANALRRAGIAAQVRTRPWLDRLAVAAVIAAAATELFAPRTRISGSVSLLAAAAVAARMSGWQSRLTRGDPLLWSLHLGGAWVALGFAAVALADLTGLVPWAVGLHAQTTGAIGTMVLAVMTRVSLGHTGRPLVAPPSALAAYLLVSAGALARTAGAVFAPPGEYLGVIALAGLLFAAAYGAFLVGYAPMLVSARSDGREG